METSIRIDDCCAACSGLLLRVHVPHAENGLVAWLKPPLIFDADALLADVCRTAQRGAIVIITWGMDFPGLRRSADENLPPSRDTLPLAGGSGSQARGGPICATDYELPQFDKPHPAATASDLPAPRGGVDVLLVNSHLSFA